MNVVIGDMIKVLRLKKGLKQSELAEQLNVTQSAIALWENGKRKPDIEMIPDIANYFGVSINYLLGVTSQGTTMTPEEQDIIQTYRETSFEGRQYIRQQIDIVKQLYKKQSDTLPGVEIA